jgi:hypothetical protein
VAAQLFVGSQCCDRSGFQSRWTSSSGIAAGTGFTASGCAWSDHRGGLEGRWADAEIERCWAMINERPRGTVMLYAWIILGIEASKPRHRIESDEIDAGGKARSTRSQLMVREKLNAALEAILA